MMQTRDIKNELREDSAPSKRVLRYIFRQMTVLSLVFFIMAPSSARSIKVPISKGPQAARVPKGMERCTKTPLVAAGRTFTQGETVRYAVSLDGLGVGTVDYKVENHGRLNNQDVTEYRSVFQLDSLLSAFVPVAGRAASIVPVGQLTPVRAMNDYHVGSKTLAEEMLFGPDAGRINVTRKVNEKTKIDKRWIHFSPIDFVSGFYYLRSLPSDFEGCTSLYGNGRIYTIWVTKAGVEEIKTPVGKRQADKYEVIYSSDKGKRPIKARAWIARDASRLPYRVEIDGSKHQLVAQVHLYLTGTDK